MKRHNPHPIRAVILDFDGVIVESNQEKTRAFGDLFDRYPTYRDAMMAYHMAHYSTPRMAKFEHFVYTLMGRPEDAAGVAAMAQQFSTLVKDRVVSCPEVRGARDFLEEYSVQVPLYLASVTPLEELTEILRLRGLTRYFTEVFGDPPFRKKEAIQRVLAAGRLRPSETMFVGDAVSDYAVSEECGLEFIGRNSGLPFDGIDIILCRDLKEIADRIRPRIGG